MASPEPTRGRWVDDEGTIWWEYGSDPPQVMTPERIFGDEDVDQYADAHEAFRALINGDPQ
jgi:hypothetical protein